MSQNDYIILRDENGKAYIAHAGLLDNARNAIRGAANSISTTAQQVANKAKGVGRGVRKNHKYILKVFENGRTRYFYKQEEVKAYYEAKKRGIKNAAEYAQNAVKDKASDVADAVKNVANKATGATANKTAETAKKNADDAHRWAKMTERAHKENLANFKQNPTEANLAKAKQSGQAVTRANQNEKNIRKEADKAQAIADQHPVNKAKYAFDQAKKSADNAVTNAKANYDRMKSEFRNKADQAGNAVRSTAKNAVDKAKDIAGYDERERFDQAKKDFNDASTKSSDLLKKVNQAGREYRKTPLGIVDSIDQTAYSAKVGAQDMIDKARTAVKDKSEDLSAKAKSTVQSARDSVKGMIENARSSTAKAVNEAWDKIPKNSDGTVNPFDKNFQSTYNDWKAKKDKYDSSLAGRAKDAAEKATDSVKDMIDQAKKTAKNSKAGELVSSLTDPNYKSPTQRGYEDELESLLSLEKDRQKANDYAYSMGGSHRSAGSFSKEAYDEAEKLTKEYDALRRNTSLSTEEREREQARLNERLEQLQKVNADRRADAQKVKNKQLETFQNKFEAVNSKLDKKRKEYEGAQQMYQRVIDTNGRNSQAAESAQKLRDNALKEYRQDLKDAWEKADAEYQSMGDIHEQSHYSSEVLDAAYKQRRNLYERYMNFLKR